jgi:hypothetical protein
LQVLPFFLVGDAAASLTGNVEYIDGAYHIHRSRKVLLSCCVNSVCRLAPTKYRDVTSWLQLIELKQHFPMRA